MALLNSLAILTVVHNSAVLLDSMGALFLGHLLGYEHMYCSTIKVKYV